MNSYKKWATIGIGLSIIVILAGCSTTATTPGSTGVPATNAPSTTNTSNQINPTTNNTVNTTVSATNATTPSTITSSNVGQRPIAPSADNFTVTNIQAPKTVSVNENAYTPPKLIHGVLEPVVMTIKFTKIQTPIYLELQNLGLNNPSSNVSGGFDYFQYQGEIYKLSKQQPEAFPVKNTIVVDGDTTITFVGSVGTPTPSGDKLQLSYGNMHIGSYTVTNTASFELK